MNKRFAWIQQHLNEHSVEKMAQALDVTSSGYYVWRKAPQSNRQRENDQLKQEIMKTWEQGRQRYGSPRITQVLRQKSRVGHNRVARLMREMGLQARSKKRWKVTTQSKHGLPIAENLLARNFEAKQPNEKWAGDITYILTAEGWLYLAVVLDLHSRKVVGWSMSKEIKTELVMDALNMATMSRRPASGLLFHSDRGVQYASGAFKQRLNQLGIQQSMSRKGNCWDNACVESFFGTMKQEGCGIFYKSRQEARIHIFEYIESFYNRQRVHSTLGYLSPECFERRFA
jgi:transposase InsO family protein